MFKWGILGAGHIAHRFADSLAHIEGASLVAISGRNQEKLDQFASKYRVPKVYLSHEDLLAEDELDAIYLALPHFLHEKWLIKAIEASRPVLCEKPALLEAGQTERVIGLATEKQVTWMEAMKSRFIPAYQQALKLSKRLGCLVKADIVHEIYIDPSEYGKAYHTQVGHGPGCLWDVGCYGLNAILDFCGQDLEIKQVQAKLMDGIDMAVYAQLENRQHAPISFQTSFLKESGAQARFVYEQGEIILKTLHRPTDFVLKQNGQEQSFHFDYQHDDFTGEILEMMDLVKSGRLESDIMSWTDTLTLARLSDRIRDQFTPK